MYLVLLKLEPLQIVEVSGKPHNGFKVWGHKNGEFVYSSKDKALPPRDSPYSLDGMDTSGNIQRRTQFETDLAALLLDEPDIYINQVKLTSDRIAAWLQARVDESTSVRSKQSPKKEKAMSDSEDEDLADDVIAQKVASYLYPRATGDRYLGMIGADAPKGKQERLLAAFQALNGNDLFVHMNFHRLFVEHIVDDSTVLDTRSTAGREGNDPHNDRYQVLRRTIQPNAKYDITGIPQRVPRVDGAVAPVTALGITTPAADNFKAIGHHTRALDKNARPSTKGHVHTFEQNADKHRMPFVAGPSASAANLFICARMMGELQNDDIAAYAMAVVAFLVGGGMHGFHEIMKSGRVRKKPTNDVEASTRAGLRYVSGDYESVMPSALKQRESYKRLALAYPDLCPSALPNMFSWHY